jgi:hypothetical protein
MTPIADLPALLRMMQPVLNPGTYVFAPVPGGRQLPADAIVASIREPEGLSVVMEESAAQRARLSPVFRCAWITLSVNSDLQAVGLTAAFSSALARAGISCNVVAGVNHDHLFVPIEQANPALEVLRALQTQSTAGV